MPNFKAMGSVSNKLLAYIGTTLVHDSNYDIAVLLVKNYDRIKGMSIGEVAELCYVSKSSISRFCRFIGFENFKEFKLCLDLEFSMSSDYSRQFYAMLCSDEQLAISAYRDELIENIYATISEENVEVVHRVIQVIHECSHVAYFSHHFLWDIGRFFQSKMMMMGKYVEQFLSYTSQLECAGRLDENSLAIICTVGGSYMSRYSEIWNKIRTSGCKILVITQNLSSADLNNADYVLRCGVSNRDDVGKYAAMMTTDYMVMAYLRKYGEL